MACIKPVCASHQAAMYFPSVSMHNGPCRSSKSTCSDQSSVMAAVQFVSVGIQQLHSRSSLNRTMAIKTTPTYYLICQAKVWLCVKPPSWSPTCPRFLASHLNSPSRKQRIEAYLCLSHVSSPTLDGSEIRRLRSEPRCLLTFHLPVS